MGTLLTPALRRVRHPDVIYHAHETTRMQQLEGLSLASFKRRAAAFLLDILAAALVFMVAAVPAGLLWERGHPGQQAHIVFAPLGREGGNWYSIIAFTAYMTLSLYLSNGRTFGKRLLGIRVVSTVRERISFLTALERALAYGVSAAEIGFGFLQYFTSANCRTTHDRIAETIVVDTRGRSEVRRP
jgi:uncharacterized RDD family membrane protein YckC